jgi:hypothetical protein
MLRQHIYIPRYDWEVVVYYETASRNAGAILAELDSIGVDDDTFDKAADNLVAGFLDTGLTYTNMDERVSVIVLSKTSSQSEFANTWFHELLHCANHIAKANGLDPMGEPIAYVGGELARSMQPIAARLMCPTCNH